MNSNELKKMISKFKDKINAEVQPIQSATKYKTDISDNENSRVLADVTNTVKVQGIKPV